MVACVDAGQYYAALRLLERVRTERLPTLPCGALREYITAQLPAAEALVEDRAKALLDLWLADAAAAARDIGRRAVAAAASSRAAVQARWDAQLVGVHCAAQPGGPPPAFSLRGAAAEEDEDPLEGLALTRVATARHALACLGKEEAFWAHYAQRRAAQLNDHLAAGEGAAGSFLESYQSYFGAVAGFFVVEGHVVRAAGGAITAGQLAASWDRAAGALSTQLAAQLARIPSAGELLLVADYVRLLAAALQQLGLWTAALDAALHEAQERYHELAGAEVLETLRRAASRDALEPVTLHNAAEYAADVVALGLHPADAPLPEADDFPLLAPFTPLVPTMLRVLKAHTGDSCSFCGAAGEEGVRTVGRFRDALLQRIVDEVLAPQLTGSHPRGAASPLVQLAANAAALDAASAAQDAECVICDRAFSSNRLTRRSPLQPCCCMSRCRGACGSACARCACIRRRYGSAAAPTAHVPRACGRGAACWLGSASGCIFRWCATRRLAARGAADHAARGGTRSRCVPGARAR